ncbi:Werner syndrome ATP-dependent helicase-like [Dendronephthya gigantea]|uniref:Werner syndrome ATP-dependent helicase-like n=1 Tax=Dendronephthya gigantea TaxID=151771 RepID=UPI00106B6AD9|nr:Werner syndrome ATP-dependent helicase-like [Dendronephthya gigantea]
MIAPVLALTATATKKIRQTVVETLSFRLGYTLIQETPNRENIYLSKATISKNFQEAFQPLIDQLRKEKENMDKTIVYCRSIKHCASLYALFKFELGSESYRNGMEHTSKNCLFAMFHHCTSETIKQHVLDSLYSPSGICRVVFATNALGMGVNFKDIRLIIHLGPPREIDDYIQEIGRAGRDGLPAKAVLYHNGILLKRASDKVREYCFDCSSECLRKILLSDFDANPSQPSIKHLCCQTCHEHCRCVGTSCAFEIVNNKVVHPCHDTGSYVTLRERTVSKKDKQLLSEILFDYQSQLVGTSNYYLSAHYSTGFSDKLIELVVQQAKYIFSVDYLMSNLPVFSRKHAVQILQIFNEVFEDIGESDIENIKKNEDVDSGSNIHLESEFPSYFFFEQHEDSSSTDD